MRTAAWRGFPLFWAGRAASQFGDRVTILALPWLLAGATTSPLVVGALEMLIFAPTLILGLPIGAYIDRRSRRRTMLQADIVRLVLLASFPLLALTSLPTTIGHILIAAFLIGIGHAAFEAAAQGFLVDLVDKDRLLGANSRLAFTESAADVLGPGLAGVLISVLGARGALGVDAVTFGLSVCALLAVHRVTERFTIGEQRVGPAIREGLRTVFGSRLFRTLIMVDTVANIGSGIVGGIVVFFLQRTLHLEGWQAGVLYAVNGAGGILASLTVPSLSRRFGVARIVVSGLCVGAAGFAALAGAEAGALSAPAVGGMVLIGLGVVGGIIAGSTLRQSLVEPEILGRATTTYRMMVHGAVALGALGGGAIGEWASVRAAMVTGAVIYVAAALLALASPLARTGRPAT